MDLRLSEAEAAFRDEARAFLAARLPPDARRARAMTTTVFAEHDLALAWHRVLFERGWVAPNWPERYGGPGWTWAERRIWSEESARAGAPSVSPIGLTLVGPVLMHFGTEEQRRRFLPRILSGEDYWCQGFSEPNAGSDLAALRTRAARDGASYVVNGTKIWTTHAHYAQEMIALTRTSTAGARQAGITCLLIDMASSGVSVRPIRTIGGDHEVNQVFLDEVRVPADRRVGEEGQGWDVAKYLLGFERGADAASAGIRFMMGQLVALLEETDDWTRARPEIAAALADLVADVDALEMMELRAGADRDGAPDAATASMLKLRASQLQQDASALALRALGERALRWEATRPLYALPPDARDAWLPVASRYLNNRANTIFGGSAEVQRGLIAKAMLGL